MLLQIIEFVVGMQKIGGGCEVKYRTLGGGIGGANENIKSRICTIISKQAVQSGTSKNDKQI